MHSVEEVENALITLSDGIKLAARLWLPKCTSQVPGILEYLPYGKRAGTYHRDELTHPYLAARGFGCVRVDIRGNGDSEGVMEDEYTTTELNDAVEVISWISTQSWCNGSVGMMGISWGGFNSLQVAALQPAALRAIITLCSSADRYHEDVHYKGGCLLNENFAWGVTMWSYSTLPPDQELISNWRELWLLRLASLPFLPRTWLRHCTRDAYWKHGSVCEDFASIEVPTLCIGGWCDGYKNTIPALMTGLSTFHTPVSAIVGPWGHKYPHFAVPEPRIGFLQIACEWFLHHLSISDSSNDSCEDGVYRLYLLHSERPSRNPHSYRSGRWIKSSVDDTCISEITWRLQMNRAMSFKDIDSVCDDINVLVDSPMHCGMAGGEYCAIWLGPDLADDQRIDDAYSACFDSSPLEEGVDIVGRPCARLRLSSTRPTAQIAVRLCDVHTDGSSALITYGVLNLAHRNSSEVPQPLDAHESYDVEVSLDFIAYSVPPGHRLRLAVSTTYWPLLWPSPERVSITIRNGILLVPQRNVECAHDECSFPSPEAASPSSIETLRHSSHRRETTTDHHSGIVTLVVHDDFGEERLSHGLVVGSVGQEVWSIHPNDPLSAIAKIQWQQTMSRKNWRMRSTCHATMTCDREYFYVTGKVNVFENDCIVHEATIDDKVKRGI